MEKGIIIAIPEKYQSIALENVQKIRSLGCDLPIEIWEIGKEISETVRAQLATINNVVFQNVEDHTKDPNHWRGFQVKAFIVKNTRFQEVILCDADIVLYQNPELLLNNPHYLSTGAYFFKDLEKWQFKNLNNKFVQWRIRNWKRGNDKFSSLEFYNKRKAWLLGLLPEKLPLFPEEWNHFYEKEAPSKPVAEALQESGLLAMNKRQQQEAIDYIYALNDNHRETYQYIWGDKETFWIGCLMANTEFFFQSSLWFSGKRSCTHT